MLATATDSELEESDPFADVEEYEDELEEDCQLRHEVCSRTHALLEY